MEVGVQWGVEVGAWVGEQHQQQAKGSGQLLATLIPRWRRHRQYSNAAVALRYSFMTQRTPLLTGSW